MKKTGRERNLYIFMILVMTMLMTAGCSEMSAQYSMPAMTVSESGNSAESIDEVPGAEESTGAESNIDAASDGSTEVEEGIAGGSDRTAGSETNTDIGDRGIAQEETGASSGENTEIDITAENAAETSGKNASENAAELAASQNAPTENKRHNLTFSSANMENAKKELPAEISAQIDRINAGEALEEIIDLEELKNCYALIGVTAITARDLESQEETVGDGELTMYVPNLLQGLSEVSGLFYDKADGQWKVLPAVSVDADAKTVTVSLSGSGMLSVIYRRGSE